jgi:hypothetical protein
MTGSEMAIFNALDLRIERWDPDGWKKSLQGTAMARNPCLKSGF